MPLKITKINQEELLREALQLTQSEGWHKDAVAFAAVRSGAALPSAIGVFQNFRAGQAELHFAVIAPHATRAVIEAFTTIAFHPAMLRLSRLWTHVPVSNQAAQRVALGFGGEFEYRLRGGAAGGEDAIVFSLVPSKTGLAAAKAAPEKLHQE